MGELLYVRQRVFGGKHLVALLEDTVMHRKGLEIEVPLDTALLFPFISKLVR